MARLAADVAAWIDSASIVGLIRAGSTAGVIGVFSESADPALWPGYADSINVCAHAESATAVDRQLRGSHPVRLLLPIETDGQAEAVLAIGPRNGKRERPYSDAEVAAVRDLCGQTGRLLRSCGVMNHAQTESDEARRIQDRLLPAHPPCIPQLECFGQCERSVEPAGDFFQFGGTELTGLSAAIGTVESRGPSACVLTTALQTLLRTQVGRDARLQELFAELNRTYWQISPDGACAALFCAHIDPANELLRYINAGNQSVLILRSSGRVNRLDANAAVLGLSRKSQYRTAAVTFSPGDTLIALSEGLSEEEDKVVWLLRREGEVSARELSSRILDASAILPGLRTTDQTVIVVRFQRAGRMGAPCAQLVHAAA